MSKKFLPLNTEQSYIKDPKRVRTFLTRCGDNISIANNKRCLDETDPNCQKKPKKATKISIEDEIFKFYEGRMAKKAFNKERRKPKCKKLDIFTECVMPQRTPSDLKIHAIAREKYLRTKRDLDRSWHNAKVHLKGGKKLIRVESPKVTDGNVKPKLVDSVNSLTTYYVPTRKLLDIKKARSGIYINQTDIKFDTKIPFEAYNPRLIQQKIEEKNIERYDLLPQDADGLYAWADITQDLDKLFFKDRNLDTKRIRSIDCINYEPKFFTIPCDTDKTFKATIIFGKTAVKPEVAVTTNFTKDSNINERRRKEIACCYAIFIESYVSNPEKWSAPKLSEIFAMGIEHWKKSDEMDYIDRCGDFDILPEIPEKYATIEIKTHAQGKLYENPNILQTIYQFFVQFPAGLIVTRDTYLLIWKRCKDTFYIFDPNGRDKNGKRDHVEGKCSLISTNLEEHVVHLILNLGLAEPNDEFIIYEINLKNFGFIPNPIDGIAKTKKKKLYAVVNKFYALVPATVGVEPPEEAIEENASLMISFIALLYSQIDPPKYWTISIVDSLIKVGGQRYVQFVRENKLDTLDINNLPNILTFGTYKTSLTKHPIVKSGHVSDCGLYRNSLLTHSIIEFFNLGYEIGLVQIDNSTMGLWKDQMFYYVFDPFKRGKAGQILSEDDDGFDDGVGCLQIHINLDSLCRIINKNALDMKLTGTFFIHGIRILSVQLLSTHHHLFNRGEFIGLNIRYPFPSKLSKFENCDDIEKKPKSGGLEIIPINCLSVLSVSPCERACSESSLMELQKIEKNRLRKLDQVKRLYSIETIPDTDRISDFDNRDIVDGVIKDFICDLMTDIKRKTEKRVKTPIEAEKILLKSDRGYLEETLRRLKCGQDYDNLCVTFNKYPPCEKMPTLEEEIAIPSNFLLMPDGNMVVFGNQVIELTKENIPFSMLSALAALVLMTKYHVHTWNGAMVDFVGEIASTLKAHYDIPERSLETIMKKRIPEIQIGKFNFRVIKKKTIDSMAMELKTVLEEMLSISKKILLVYNTFSCAITQPGHLYYLYMAFPSDAVGFRTSGSGPTALIRFTDLDTLVQRIESNRFCLNETQSFAMMALEIRRVSKDPLPIYLTRAESDEKLAIENELTTKAKADKRLAAKMAFISDEIRKEKQRVLDFLREKKRKMNKGKDLSDDYEGEGEMEDEIEDEDFYEPKHKPGRILSNMDTFDDPVFVKSDPGYKLTEEECMFKIQGTTSLDDRTTSGATQIKSCYIAAVYAILNSISMPVHKWDPHRIDKIIESTKEMDQRVKDRNNVCSRIIKNIRVDDYIFNVIVKVVDLWHPNANIDYYVDIVSQTRSFFIIQITNGCFAVYKDEYYHLFDPYPTLVKIKDDDEKQKNKKNNDCPESIYKVPDKNTASWVLFADLQDLFKYIDKRAAIPEWRNKNKILAVDILSFKQSSRKERISYYVNDEIDCTGQTPKYEDITCLKTEKVLWLENSTKLVPWSRLNQKEHVRYLHSKPTNKDKSYEIEVPDKIFSLWGTIHPLSIVFRKTKGKQYLACNVIACCMASVFKITEWNSKVIDSIIINGDKYFQQSIEDIVRKEHEFNIEDLNLEYKMDYLNFKIHLESVVYGCIYSKRKKEFNMASALGYFFERHRFGVIQSLGHSIAVGRGDKGYFMFDCQTHGLPIFQKDQGTGYVLRTNTLQTLLYCIIMTFGIPFYNIEFVIHKVEVSTEKAMDNEEEEEEEEENN